MSWTLAAIVHDPTGFGGDAEGMICGVQGGGTPRMAMSLDGNGNVYGEFWDGAATEYGGFVAASYPSVLAVSGDGSTIKTYVDGALEDTTVAVGDPSLDNLPFYAGLVQSGQMNLGHVLWYARALSGAEHAQLAAAQGGAETMANAVAAIGTPFLYWPLQESASPIFDVGPHGFTGTAVGGPTLGVSPGFAFGDPGDVRAEFPTGYIVTSATFPLAAGDPPTVDSITPSSGPVAGGTAVVIAGNDLTGATDVDFGATPAASFVVDSDTQISAVSPAHAAGTVQVVVTTPEGSSG